jgi:hypothetical protein
LLTVGSWAAAAAAGVSLGLALNRAIPWPTGLLLGGYFLGTFLPMWLAARSLARWHATMRP